MIIAENEIMLQDMLNIVGEYGRDFKVKFSSVEMNRWRLGGLGIKRTNEYKYLGIPVTVNGFDKSRGDKKQMLSRLQWGGGGEKLSGLAKQRANKYEVTRGL